MSELQFLAPNGDSNPGFAIPRNDLRETEMAADTRSVRIPWLLSSLNTVFYRTKKETVTPSIANSKPQPSWRSIRQWGLMRCRQLLLHESFTRAWNVAKARRMLHCC